MFGKNYTGSKARTVGFVAALTDEVEAITRRDDPSVVSRAFQILAEILENSRMFWGNGREVVECFIYACRQTRGCDIVSQNALIYDLSKKCSPWNEFIKKMRNISL